MFDVIVSLAVFVVGSCVVTLVALIAGALCVARWAALFGGERAHAPVRTSRPARRSVLVHASQPHSSPVPL
jgi:hypothetical protein